MCYTVGISSWYKCIACFKYTRISVKERSSTQNMERSDCCRKIIHGTLQLLHKRNFQSTHSYVCKQTNHWTLQLLHKRNFQSTHSYVCKQTNHWTLKLIHKLKAQTRTSVVELSGVTNSWPGSVTGIGTSTETFL